MCSQWLFLSYNKPKRINERVIAFNDKPVNSGGRYVLYWMQMYKRVDDNHALIWAIRKANELKLPLVVYEGLKYYYPWASDRLHTFILEGVEQKRLEFDRLGIRYVFLFAEGCGFAKVYCRISRTARRPDSYG